MGFQDWNIFGMFVSAQNFDLKVFFLRSLQRKQKQERKEMQNLLFNFVTGVEEGFE